MNDNEALFRQVADGSISTAAALVQLREAQAGKSEPIASSMRVAPATASGRSMQGFTLDYFTRKIADALSITPKEIDPDAELMDLGIESVNLLQMADEIEAELSITLYPTVFFEYTTLTAVAGFFAQEHCSAFEALMESGPDAAVSPSAAVCDRVEEASSVKEDAVPLVRPVPEPVDIPPTAAAAESSGQDPGAFALDYLTRKVAGALSVRPKDIDRDAELMDLGIESATLLQMTDELETELSITLYPTVFFEHPTLAAVAGHLASEHAGALAHLMPKANGSTEAPPLAASTPAPVFDATVSPSESRPEGADTEVVINHVRTLLGEILSVPHREIDPDADIRELGLDSAALTALAERLERDGVPAVNPALLFGHDTLRSLVRALREAGVDLQSALESNHDAAPSQEITAGPHGTTLYVVEDRRIDARSVSRPEGEALWIVPDGLALPIDGTGLRPGSAECAAALARARADGAIAVNVVLDTRSLLRDDLHGRLSSFMTDLSAIVSSLGSRANNALTLGVLGTEGHGSVLAHATSAFLKSVCHEYERLRVFQLDLSSSVENGEAIADAMTKVRALGDGAFTHASLDGQRWSIRTAAPTSLTPNAVRLREQAVVVITGGTGALGQLFAAHLARHHRARVVLTGRRSGFELPAALDALAEAGGSIRYEPCDVTDRNSVKDMFDRVSIRYGRIDGIIHSAGTIDDAPILRKTAESRHAVTTPKVDGILHLDELSSTFPLDFLVCFSSVAGFTGNRGQSDYAAANGFMDGFMLQREDLRRRGLRSGKSLSINWPLWTEGGMRPPQIVRELMEKRLGLRPMESDIGLAVFDRALASKPTQIAVFSGDVHRIDDWVMASSPSLADVSTQLPEPASPASVSTPSAPRPKARTKGPRTPTPTPTPDSHKADEGARAAPLATTIAVVGIDGTFPQSPDLEGFWDNLVEGRDLISNRLDRWTFDGYLDLTSESMATALPSVEAGYIDDCAGFDHTFFNISHSEASLMDPQQRLALRSAWRAIENAGYDPASLRGERMGVFAGSSTRDFQTRYGTLAKRIEADKLFGAHLATGFAPNNIPNRISYVLDVTGPSELVDTACSSSLVALNRASDAIRLGQCDSALVIGVNMILEGSIFAAFKATGLLSDRHRCKSFGKDGAGYVRSEGVGSVLIKSLAKAEADQDDIRAVLRAVKVNHGGRVQSLTAPNPRQQAAVVRDALLEASVPPASVSYVEAHGTGTALGDSVEVLGLKSAFAQTQAIQSGSADLPAGTTRIGSVKSNMGHLEAAAGIAGLIKVVLCLQNRVLPASIHSEEENPFLDLEGSPFLINHETIPWRRSVAEDGSEYPLRAGVSSFGFGGTNGHVIVEEAPASFAPETAATGPLCIPLSAPSSEQLDTLAERLLVFLRNQLERNQAPRLTDIAFTLQNGRAARTVRVCFVVGSLPHLLDALQAFRDGRESAEIKTGDQPLAGSLKRALNDDAMRVLTGHYMQTGDMDGLGLSWAAGLPVVWSALPGSDRAKRIALPGHVFRDTTCWPVPVAEKGEVRVVETSDAERVAEPTAEPTSGSRSARPGPTPSNDIVAYVSSAVAEKLGCDSATIDADTDLAEYGFDSILAVQLLDDLKRTYDIPLFVAELRGRRTIRELTAYIAGEMDGRTDERQTGHPDPIFLLSAPRSGSTLLRAMMMGHPDLFAPPELHLLGFETMGARAKTLGTSGLGDGLVEAFSHLRSVSPDRARADVATLEDRDVPIAEVYAELQGLCAPRILVDKSPTYGASIDTLKRAVDLFSQPRFVHLVRRPEAMMTSFVVNRFHRMLGVEQDRAWATADQVWNVANRTIADFVASVDAGAALRLHYEDLVRHPEVVCRRIGEWLGLPFAGEMLEPYAEGRLVHGLKSGSRSVGDPNFLDHKEIDAREATEWITSDEDIPVDGDSIRSAHEFGYDTGARFATLHGSTKPATWVLSLRYEVEGLHKVSQRDAVVAVRGLLRLYPILSSRWDPSSSQLVTEGTVGPIVSVSTTRKRKVDALRAELDGWRETHGAALGGEGEPSFAVHLLRHANGCAMELLVNHHACDGASARIAAETLLSLLQSSSVRPPVPAEGYASLLSRRNGLSPRDEGTVAEEPIRLAPFVLSATPPGSEKPLVEETHQLDDVLPTPLLVSPHLPDCLGAGLLLALRSIEEIDAATILLRHHGRVGPSGIFHGSAIGNLALDLAIPSGTADLTREDFATRRRAALKVASTQPLELLQKTEALSNVRLNFQDLAPLESGPVVARMIDAREVRAATVRTTAGHPLLDLIVRRADESGTLIVRHEDGAFSGERLARLRERWLEITSAVFDTCS